VHVWPKNNGDVFTHNIFSGYAPISPDGWGKQLDFNFFTSAAGLTAAHGNGTDANSTSGNVTYVDAANGNYQLPPNSPAVAVGIKSLPNDQYGVVSLSLRAQARTPFLGAITAEVLPSSAAPASRVVAPAGWQAFDGGRLSRGYGWQSGRTQPRRKPLASATCEYRRTREGGFRQPLAIRAAQRERRFQTSVAIRSVETTSNA
jgi:hypothetical protein